jgi:hypothetical protein
VDALKVISCRTMTKKKGGQDSKQIRFYGQNKLYILAPYPSTLQQFQPHGCMLELLRKNKEKEDRLGLIQS